MSFRCGNIGACLWEDEVGRMSDVCLGMALGLMDVRQHHDRLLSLLVSDRRRRELGPYPGDADFRSAALWQERFQHLARDSQDIPPGHPGGGEFALGMRALLLNTAVRAGADPVRLAACLVWQSWDRSKAKAYGGDIRYSWCEGHDRAWLARLIIDGITTGLFQGARWGEDPAMAGKRIHALTAEAGKHQPGTQAQGQGWEAVASFLLARDSEPVVAEWEEQPFGSGQGGTVTERWRQDVSALRAGKGRRIAPDTLGKVSFGHGLSWFDLAAPDWQMRLSQVGITGRGRGRPC